MGKNLIDGRWQGLGKQPGDYKPVRRVVTPSGGIMRGKFPSWKNYRMVRYEGHLERDALFLFEATPRIATYSAQPCTLHYADGDKLRRYTPDFGLVLRSGETVLVEVKTERSLRDDPEIRHSLECISAHMRSTNQTFLILTDSVIRRQPRLANLCRIHADATWPPPTAEACQRIARLCGARLPATLREATAMFSGDPANMFSLLLSGELTCNLDSPLTDDSVITTKEASDDWLLC